ncbi:MAG: hypothetical protein GXO43_03830 [Crenarchaeota archaeon]|nr:hypothetical protein [Thermoproteota archaeon]
MLNRVNPFGKSGYEFVLEKFGDSGKIARLIIKHCEGITPGSGLSRNGIDLSTARLLTIHYFTESFTIGFNRLKFPSKGKFAGSIILNPIDRARIAFPHVKVDDFKIKVDDDGYISSDSKVELEDILKNQLLFMIDRGVIGINPQWVSLVVKHYNNGDIKSLRKVIEKRAKKIIIDLFSALHTDVVVERGESDVFTNMKAMTARLLLLIEPIDPLKSPKINAAVISAIKELFLSP